MSWFAGFEIETTWLTSLREGLNESLAAGYYIQMLNLKGYLKKSRKHYVKLSSQPRFYLPRIVRGLKGSLRNGITNKNYNFSKYGI